jgi:cytolysin-activating lysine-acyltransferase
MWGKRSSAEGSVSADPPSVAPNSNQTKSAPPQSAAPAAIAVGNPAERIEVPAAARRKKSASEFLAEAVVLFTQSSRHRHLFIADIEWLILPAINLQQFRMFYTEGKPIGIALWACVNEQVSARLRAGEGRLSPPDWKCGDIVWLMDLISPYANQMILLNELKRTTFADSMLNYSLTENGISAARAM